MFHGVIEDNPFKIRNHNRKHIFKDEFYDLLTELKKIGTAISIDQFTSGEKIPDYSFLVTFDDGFENNYSVAAPILIDQKIPTTFYVSTDFIGRNKMSWVDQIDYAIENTEKEKILFLKEEVNIRNRNEKIEFLDHARNYLKRNDKLFSNKENIIHDLFESCKVTHCDTLYNSIDKKMNWSQVAELSKNELFTIGGHTHTHPIMSYLSEKDLNDEIKLCVELIEKNCKLDCKHFSYPEGLDYCYNDKVIRKLKEYGVFCCPAVGHGVNKIDSDFFRLKRIQIS